MPTTLPRIHTSWDEETYTALHRLSVSQKKSEAEVVSELVHYALALLEDMHDSEVAERRIATFDRSTALTTEQMLGELSKRAKSWGKKRSR